MVYHARLSTGRTGLEINRHMDYQKHYNALIMRAQNRTILDHTETHHIIPRCLGGDNKKSNLVELTPEEHYIAHLLLVKIHNDARLVYAAHKMCQGRATNKLYGWLRRKHAKHVSAHMKKQGNSQTGSVWITDGKQNKKAFGKIPSGWWKGRVSVPQLTQKINICMKCVTDAEDKYWWQKYKQSNLSVTDFVNRIYPYNRAAFYKLKNRMVL